MINNKWLLFFNHKDSKKLKMKIRSIILVLKYIISKIIINHSIPKFKDFRKKVFSS